jgi:acyl dehydratase
VALNSEYVGRVFGPGEPYEVSRVKIADFAGAIGEPSEFCRDRDAALKAGYPDVIAPPTFAIVIAMASTASVEADPGLGLDYSMVVHGEQSFSYSRPLHAGDVVVATCTVESIRALGGMSMMVTSTDISTTGGEHVCTAKSTIIERAQQGGTTDGR